MTSNLFPVFSISSDQIVGDEQLGSKEKFWFRQGGSLWLFKEVRVIEKSGVFVPTGEDWAEKVAAEIAHLMNIPAATVELAEFQGRWGCASLNFTSPAQQLMHGNEVMAGYLKGYDPEMRFQQSSHTVENIIKAIRAMFPKANEHRTVLRQLASYLVLDALIGNTDRHHENWGLLWQVLVNIDEVSEAARLEKQYDIAPSFDHASSLGRELLDEKRADILRRGAVEAYVRKGKGGIFFPDGKRGANPLELVESTANDHPDYFQPTLAALRGVPLAKLTDILDRVPHDRISNDACAFAKEMLRVAYESLRRIGS
ncbi:MAG TPA: HipA domain-containing protein [Azonexus sp.]|nr:HipA domain-containing protein [Azonexus sp.]